MHRTTEAAALTVRRATEAAGAATAHLIMPRRPLEAVTVRQARVAVAPLMVEAIPRELADTQVAVAIPQENARLNLSGSCEVTQAERAC